MILPQPTAAVVNTSPDTVEILRVALSYAGIVVVSCYSHDIRDGKIDFEAFLRAHDPKVIVYDIAPPYERNWRLFQHVHAMPAMKGRQVILTSTNKQRVEELIAPDQPVYEVVDKPLNLDIIVQATREAFKARPTQ